MVWLARSQQKAPAASGNQRQFYRQSIELPIAVSVRGLPAPVYGTLINISETGCRLRSLILLDRNRLVEFTLSQSSTAPLTLRGRVLSRATPQTDAGYEYGVAFEDMTQQQREQLTRHISEMQRRAAAARTTARDEAKAAGGGAQRRTAVRTIIAFPIRYKAPSRSAASGEANDISAGGMRLLCGDALSIGTELELRFTLPDGVLSAYPKAADRVEITPFGQRVVKIPDNRRPFDEMVIRAKVLSRHDPQRGREVYGLGFLDVDGYQREEIARFTHAVQLTRIRTTGKPA